MASPDVHRTTADIITAIRAEYIAILPSHEAEKMLAMLKAKVHDDVPVGEAFQEFEDVYKMLPDHLKGTLGGHFRLKVFLAKWPQSYQDRVNQQLNIFYPTDAERAWTGDLIRDVTDGEPPPAPADDTASAAAVNRNSEDFTAGKQEGRQSALHLQFCFHHGYGTHSSLACTVMHSNYGTYTEDNPHRAKYLCNMPGQNVDQADALGML